jgi:4-hydroxybenzoate polyprenyltransferase
MDIRAARGTMKDNQVSNGTNNNYAVDGKGIAVRKVQRSLFHRTSGVMSNYRWFQILITMRPKQWIKNTVVFAAMIFSQKLFEPGTFVMSFLAFFLFCLISGSVYLFNDVIDREEDKRHPFKKLRPVASGSLSTPTAITWAALLAIISLGVAILVDGWFGVILATYYGINLAYSRYLKHLVIIDVMVIALGFVLRAIGGAVIINVEISPWLIICTTLLALFLGFGKRRHELITMNEEAHNHRPILSEYSPYFLDQMISVLTASTVVAYALYTMSTEVQAKLHTTHLNLTIPFVLYGIFRYLYLIHQRKRGGNPTSVLFTDRPLLINIVLWMITVCIILYF